MLFTLSLRFDMCKFSYQKETIDKKTQMPTAFSLQWATINFS